MIIKFPHAKINALLVGYRIKSVESIISKYDRYYPDHQVRKVFNDILGFRALCDSYEPVLSDDVPEMFHVADLSKEKADDDGYRGVHVYYQKSSVHYPIEIQFNTLYDRQLNNWMHDYLYKKEYSSMVGKELRMQYESRMIKNEAGFREALEDVLSRSKE